MAFNTINDPRGFIILILLTLPLITTTNIDCNGKAFHCVNSTHFMICVDFGAGVSTTIDDFVIPCPYNTVCDPSNTFECEFETIVYEETTTSAVDTTSVGTNEGITPNPAKLSESTKVIPIITASIQQVTTVTTETLVENINAFNTSSLPESTINTENPFVTFTDTPDVIKVTTIASEVSNANNVTEDILNTFNPVLPESDMNNVVDLIPNNQQEFNENKLEGTNKTTAEIKCILSELSESAITTDNPIATLPDGRHLLFMALTMPEETNAVNTESYSETSSPLPLSESTTTDQDLSTTTSIQELTKEATTLTPEITKAVITENYIQTSSQINDSVISTQDFSSTLSNNKSELTEVLTVTTKTTTITTDDNITTTLVPTHDTSATIPISTQEIIQTTPMPKITSGVITDGNVYTDNYITNSEIVVTTQDSILAFTEDKGVLTTLASEASSALNYEINIDTSRLPINSMSYPDIITTSKQDFTEDITTSMPEIISTVEDNFKTEPTLINSGIATTQDPTVITQGVIDEATFSPVVSSTVTFENLPTSPESFTTETLTNPIFTEDLNETLSDNKQDFIAEVTTGTPEITSENIFEENVNDLNVSNITNTEELVSAVTTEATSSALPSSLTLPNNEEVITIQYTIVTTISKITINDNIYTSSPTIESITAIPDSTTLPTTTIKHEFTENNNMTVQPEVAIAKVNDTVTFIPTISENSTLIANTAPNTQEFKKETTLFSPQEIILESLTNSPVVSTKTHEIKKELTTTNSPEPTTDLPIDELITTQGGVTYSHDLDMTTKVNTELTTTEDVIHNDNANTLLPNVYQQSEVRNEMEVNKNIKTDDINTENPTNFTTSATTLNNELSTRKVLNNGNESGVELLDNVTGVPSFNETVLSAGIIPESLVITSSKSVISDPPDLENKTINTPPISAPDIITETITFMEENLNVKDADLVMTTEHIEFTNTTEVYKEGYTRERANTSEIVKNTNSEIMNFKESAPTASYNNSSNNPDSNTTELTESTQKFNSLRITNTEQKLPDSKTPYASTISSLVPSTESIIPTVDSNYATTLLEQETVKLDDIKDTDKLVVTEVTPDYSIIVTESPRPSELTEPSLILETPKSFITESTRMSQIVTTAINEDFILEKVLKTTKAETIIEDPVVLLQVPEVSTNAAPSLETTSQPGIVVSESQYIATPKLNLEVTTESNVPAFTKNPPELFEVKESLNINQSSIQTNQAGGVHEAVSSTTPKTELIKTKEPKSFISKVPEKTFATTVIIDTDLKSTTSATAGNLHLIETTTVATDTLTFPTITENPKTTESVTIYKVTESYNANFADLHLIKINITNNNELTQALNQTQTENVKLETKTYTMPTVLPTDSTNVTDITYALQSTSKGIENLNSEQTLITPTLRSMESSTTSEALENTESTPKLKEIVTKQDLPKFNVKTTTKLTTEHQTSTRLATLTHNKEVINEDFKYSNTAAFEKSEIINYDQSTKRYDPDRTAQTVDAINAENVPENKTTINSEIDTDKITHKNIVSTTVGRKSVTDEEHLTPTVPSYVKQNTESVNLTSSNETAANKPEAHILYERTNNATNDVIGIVMSTTESSKSPQVTVLHTEPVIVEGINNKQPAESYTAKDSHQIVTAHTKPLKATTEANVEKTSEKMSQDIALKHPVTEKVSPSDTVYKTGSHRPELMQITATASTMNNKPIERTEVTLGDSSKTINISKMDDGSATASPFTNIETKQYNTPYPNTNITHSNLMSTFNNNRENHNKTNLEQENRYNEFLAYKLSHIQTFLKSMNPIHTHTTPKHVTGDKGSTQETLRASIKMTSQSPSIRTITSTKSTPHHNISTPHPASDVNRFICQFHHRGRFADSQDCRKYYVCIGRIYPIVGMCPLNTVFSEIRKQCTNNLSHCVRNNQFQCVSEGRFSDYRNDNTYYVCVRNKSGSFVRFKLQCMNGYHFNSTSVACQQNTDLSISSDHSRNMSDGSIKSGGNREEDGSFECEDEGKFPDPSDCRRYYVCKKSRHEYRRKRKKCDSDEIFHRDMKKCVDEESYECESL